MLEFVCKIIDLILKHFWCKLTVRICQGSRSKLERLLPNQSSAEPMTGLLFLSNDLLLRSTVLENYFLFLAF